MKLFGQLVRTVVNVAALPVAAAADLTGLSIVHIVEKGEPLTVTAIRRLKDEADEKPRYRR
jgi:hypothetical protein